MKKQLLKSALVAVAGVGLLAGSAMADLPELTGTYQWTDADYWTITDLSNGQAAFELEWRNSQASYGSSFGIYSLSDPSTIFETHEIFGIDKEPTEDPSADTAASVWFKLVGSTWQVSSSENGTYVDFGNVFGFYADVDTNNDGEVDYTWYSDTAIQELYSGNSTEHFFIAYDKENHSTIIYLEDLPGGNVGSDSVDMLVSSSDLTPAPVPEPATMLLFGTGLLGLAGVARRRKDS